MNLLDYEFRWLDYCFRIRFFFINEFKLILVHSLVFDNEICIF